MEAKRSLINLYSIFLLGLEAPHIAMRTSMSVEAASPCPSLDEPVPFP